MMSFELSERDGAILRYLEYAEKPLQGHLHSEQMSKKSGMRSVLNLLVIGYAISAWLSGLALIIAGGIEAVAGILLYAHGTIWSAMLSHECMHGTLCSSTRANRRLGRVLTMLSGASVVSYDLLRKQHLSHHRDSVGYDGFTVVEWARSLPAFVRSMIIALEYAYFPILSMVTRARSLVMPFLQERHRFMRPRLLMVLSLRVVALVLAFCYNPWSLLSLLIGYVLVVTTFRVYDCFHHTFDVVPLGTQLPKLSRDYELQNTYSSLLGGRSGWINAVFLNYGFHNAHHAKPSAHWVDLPKIDQSIYGTTEAHCINGVRLLSWYHRYRTTRIREGLGRPKVENGLLRLDGYYGIIMNISFIVYDV